MSYLTPMMSSSELSLLEKYVTSRTSVCEYGSGGSTAWLSQRAKTVYSIEHNAEWYERTTRSLSLILYKNVEIRLVQNAKSWDSTTDGSYEDFEEYIRAPEKSDIDFTFFFVDGRARVECCKFISEKFPDATVAFHDYINRANDTEHNYARVLKYLDLIEEVDTLAIFRTKR